MRRIEHFLIYCYLDVAIPSLLKRFHWHFWCFFMIFEGKTLLPSAGESHLQVLGSCCWSGTHTDTGRASLLRTIGLASYYGKRGKESRIPSIPGCLSSFCPHLAQTGPRLCLFTHLGHRPQLAASGREYEGRKLQAGALDSLTGPFLGE